LVLPFAAVKFPVWRQSSLGSLVFVFIAVSVFKAVAGLSFSGLLHQLLLMAALFPFKRLISNKSPKLTPTRTGFTSKAAAAQLISALAC